MSRGLLYLPLAPGLASAAPRSGSHLGIGQAGPVTLRLFRQAPTRLAVVGAVEAAELLAIRAASVGATIVVMTRRDSMWGPAVGHSPDGHVVAPGPGATQSVTGQAVIVDDRPEEPRGTGEVGDWQCRLDVRTPRTGSDLASLGNADAVLVGRMDAELAAAVPSIFAVAPAHPAHLTSLAEGVIAVLRRGALDYVTLDPTPSEAALLRSS
jgi:hypothetical protein